MLSCRSHRPIVYQDLKGLAFYRGNVRIASYTLTDAEKHACLWTLPRHGLFAHLTTDMVRELCMYLSASHIDYIIHNIQGFIALYHDTTIWQRKGLHDLGNNTVTTLCEYKECHKEAEIHCRCGNQQNDLCLDCAQWRGVSCRSLCGGLCPDCKIMRGDIEGAAKSFTSRQVCYVYHAFPSTFEYAFRNRHWSETTLIVKYLIENNLSIPEFVYDIDPDDVLVYYIKRREADKYVRVLYRFAQTVPDGRSLELLYDNALRYDQTEFLCWILCPTTGRLPDRVLDFLARNANTLTTPYPCHPRGLLGYVEHYIEITESRESLHRLASTFLMYDVDLSGKASRSLDRLSVKERFEGAWMLCLTGSDLEGLSYLKEHYKGEDLTTVLVKTLPPFRLLERRKIVEGLHYNTDVLSHLL